MSYAKYKFISNTIKITYECKEVLSPNVEVKEIREEYKLYFLITLQNVTTYLRQVLMFLAQFRYQN